MAVFFYVFLFFLPPPLYTRVLQERMCDSDDMLSDSRNSISNKPSQIVPSIFVN